MPLWILLLLAGVACNSPASSEQSATEEETTEATTETEETEEAPAEDTSQRKSPPREVTGKVGDVDVTVKYGSPSVRGRDIWGALVPYDQVWRTGANEATTIEVSGDVMVEGQLLPAGKYSLFTIPGAEKWTVIFNKEAEQWGAYDYKETEDALRVEVMPQAREESMEAMTFTLEEGQLALHWDMVMVPVAMAASES